MEPRYTIPKDAKVRIEMIDRKRALELLSNTAENRNISPVRVAAYLQVIQRGDWHWTNQGIAIRDDGALVDGQHRLWAVVEADIAVPVTVTYGVKAVAVEAIDKGRSRSIGDELTMFEGVKNAAFCVAIVKQAASLYAGDRMSFATRSIFHEWYECFKPGVDFMVTTLASSTPNEVRRAPVAGSLAFAHKTAPAKIEEFALKLKEGTGLTKGEPAWAIRRALMESQYARQNRAAPPTEVARKVLRAAMVHIQGGKVGAVQDSEAGITFFKQAYAESRKMKTLVAPFRAVAGEKSMSYDESALKAAQALDLDRAAKRQTA